MTPLGNSNPSGQGPRSPPMAAASSSTSTSTSSTLSPLARPFTIGSLPRDRTLYPIPPVPNNPLANYYPPYVMADDVFDHLPQWEGYTMVGSQGFQEGGAADGLIPTENSLGVWHGKDASSFTREVHFGSKCSEWSHDGHPTIHKEGAMAPCSISRESVLASGSLPKGISYSQSSDSSIDFSSNSYTFMGYLGKACSTSDQVPAKIGCSMVQQPVDPYKTNSGYEVNKLTSTKELNYNQVVEVKEVFHEMMGKNSTEKYISAPRDTFSLKTSLPPGNELANGTTEAESGSTCEPLNISSAFISTCSPAESNDSVDSPCWKGALVSRQSPFGAAATLGLHSVVEEWTRCDDLDQGQNRHFLGHVYSEIAPLEQIVYSDTCKEQLNEGRKYQNRSSEEVNRSAPIGKETVFSVVQPITGHAIANLEKDLKSGIQESTSAVTSHGKPSLMGSDVELLVKTMYNLSEVLLSSHNSGVNELRENDHKLLKMAVHNLETFTLRRKKAFAAGSCHVSSLEAAASQDIGLKTDAMSNIKNITINDMKGKMHSSVLSNGSKGGKTNKMGQSFEEVLEKTLFEPEENPEARVYKNLWMEAEAALFSMKYELQLARVKIETDSHRQQLNGRLLRLTNLSSLSSTHDIDERDTLRKAEERSSTSMTPHRDDARITEEVDASMLARLGVLKGRIDDSNPTTIEQEMHLSLINSRACTEANETTDIPLPMGGSKAQYNCSIFSLPFS